MEQQVEDKRWYGVLLVPQIPPVVFVFETEALACTTIDGWLESFRVDYRGADGVRHKIALPGAASFTLMDQPTYEKRSSMIQQRQATAPSNIVTPAGVTAFPQRRR